MIVIYHNIECGVVLLQTWSELLENHTDKANKMPTYNNNS